MDEQDNLLKIEGAESAPVSPAIAVGSIALNMAMKFEDICIVKDGQLYQQLKIEGHNFRSPDLEEVFRVARKIELHLMGTANRLSELVFDAVVEGLAEELATDADQDPEPSE